MLRINFLEQLCEKLFESKEEHSSFDEHRTSEHINEHPHIYHSITCLCGGAYIKDTCQGFKYCSVCGTTDLLLEYVPEYNYENGPYYFHGSKSKHQFPGNGILLLNGFGNPMGCRLAVDKLRNDNQNRNNGN